MPEVKSDIRAKAWVRFAAGYIGRKYASTEEAVRHADTLLNMFDQRFGFDEDGKLYQYRPGEKEMTRRDLEARWRHEDDARETRGKIEYELKHGHTVYTICPSCHYCAVADGRCLRCGKRQGGQG